MPETNRPSMPFYAEKGGKRRPITPSMAQMFPKSMSQMLWDMVPDEEKYRGGTAKTATVLPLMELVKPWGAVEPLTISQPFSGETLDAIAQAVSDYNTNRS